MNGLEDQLVGLIKSIYDEYARKIKNSLQILSTLVDKIGEAFRRLIEDVVDIQVLVRSFIEVFLSANSSGMHTEIILELMQNYVKNSTVFLQPTTNEETSLHPLVHNVIGILLFFLFNE